LRSVIPAGAKVALLDLNGEACEKYARTLDATENKVLAYQADVTDEAQIQAVVDQIMARFQRIDILVNNAGICITSPSRRKQWPILNGLSKSISLVLYPM